ncbi:MAG: class I SAM-dependent methyltransferase [Rhodobacteraceae bacterium]|nr:class I SAM-dependent methyltransferase [Paracoccaceae bacterium]
MARERLERVLRDARREGANGIASRAYYRALFLLRGVDFGRADLPTDPAGLPGLEHAYFHRATGLHHLRRLVEAIPAPDREPVLNGTFVDLGCGKGRALHAAHVIGFRRIVGVELVGAFAATARRNMEALGVSGAEIIDGNAAEFSFPGDTRLVFMFNPFRDAVMRQVAANLARVPVRPVYVGYSFAVHLPALTAMLPDLEEVWHDPESESRVLRLPAAT